MTKRTTALAKLPTETRTLAVAIQPDAQLDKLTAAAIRYAAEYVELDRAIFLDQLTSLRPQEIARRIVTVEDLEEARRVFAKVKAVCKQQETYYNGQKKPILEAGRACDTLRNERTKRVDAIARLFGEAAAHAERRLQEDRDREAIRLANEARAAAEAEQRARAEALRAEAAQAPTRKEARQLERDAVAIETAPPVFEVPFLDTTIPKTEGQHTRWEWRAKIVDEDKLWTLLLRGRVPRRAVTWNESFFNDQAKELEADLAARYDGAVEASQKPIPVAR